LADKLPKEGGLLRMSAELGEKASREGEVALLQGDVAYTPALILRSAF